MAYNSYFPTGYQPYYQQPMTQQNYQPQMAQPQQSGIVWVQGIEGAKAHPVAAGQSVLLMDSDANCLYLKSADQTGMPSLRVFDYTERLNAPSEPKNGDLSGFITKDELTHYVTKDELKSTISELIKKGKKKDE